MSRIKVLVAVFLGTLAYVFVSVGFGPESFWASQQLNEQKQIISVNLQHIQQVNENLTLEQKGLKVDPDVIAAYAKKLGYIYPDEKLIRLKGISSPTDFVPETGTPITIGKINFVPEWLCKLSGIFIFGCFMTIFAMQELRKKLQVKNAERFNYYENPQTAI